MTRFPFLRPKLVTAEELLPYLQQMDRTRIYSNFGPLNAKFEARVMAEYFGDVGAAVTVHNATVGLMLAVKAAMRPKGRLAVMPSFTFAATAQAALWCGLQPYFVDVRSDNFCINEEKLVDTVAGLGDEVGVVMPYAAFGTSCDLEIYAALQLRGIPVVVDAAASFGTLQNDQQFGCGFPGFVVFSFHATKAFGIGEGGMVYSGSTEGIRHVRESSNFGFSTERRSEVQGLNGKLSEYGAAVGLAALDHYEARIARREAIYRAYVAAMSGRNMLDRGWALQATTGRIAHQFMTVLCPTGIDRERLILELDRRGVQARTYFSPPCHQHPVFSNCPRTLLTVTDDLSARVLNLPMWDDMADDDVDAVVEALASL